MEHSTIILFSLQLIRKSARVEFCTNFCFMPSLHFIFATFPHSLELKFAISLNSLLHSNDALVFMIFFAVSSSLKNSTFPC